MIKNSHRLGFTLIEVLVVMVIIGILIRAASVSLSGVSDKAYVESEASYIYKLLKSMPEEAILAKKEIGLGISNNSLDFLEYNEKTSQWEPYKGATGKSNYKLDESVKAELEIEGNNVSSGNSGKPAMVFYSSGESTPFTLRIMSKDDATIGFTIRTDKSDEIIFEEKK